ncbi:MAG TPA: hypothetical protein ENJ22_00195 [Gammaproteobacteria bacterium]|nr:hypothetical protein [Gammaproteobacteria bacterium]
MGSARERLAQISHHFLSEEEETVATPPAPSVTSLIISHAPGYESALSPAELAAALCRHGATAVIIAPGASRDDVSLHVPWHGENRTDAMTPPDAFKDLRSLLENDARNSRRFVLSTHRGEDATGVTGSQCLMLVQAHHEGLREGYGRLKALVSKGRPALLGVIVCDAASSKSSRYHYHKLATAAQRFLGIRIISYGALATTPSPWAAGESLAPKREERIHHIASMLIQDWQAYQQSLNEERIPT